jgi:GMP synthase-like glutamine amidotransferase
VMGTQFHPEKSSASGMALLANFTAATKRSMASTAQDGTYAN